MIVLYGFTLAISIMDFSDNMVNFIGKLFFCTASVMLFEFGYRISKMIAKELNIYVLFV